MYVILGGRTVLAPSSTPFVKCLATASGEIYVTPQKPQIPMYFYSVSPFGCVSPKHCERLRYYRHYMNGWTILLGSRYLQPICIHAYLPRMYICTRQHWRIQIDKPHKQATQCILCMQVYVQFAAINVAIINRYQYQYTTMPTYSTMYICMYYYLHQVSKNVVGSTGVVAVVASDFYREGSPTKISCLRTGNRYLIHTRSGST